MAIKYYKAVQEFRYAEEGDPLAPQTLFLLHGYKQLAPRFIKKFHALTIAGLHLVAPEGSHRFYISGSQGHVGASWMTKEDREVDIENYVNMLDACFSQVMEKKQNLGDTVVLGFSQGAATAVRWLVKGKIKPTSLVLWAGSLPRDMKLQSMKEALVGVNLFILTGDEDEILTQEHIVNAKDWLDELDVQYQWIQYKGGHSITQDGLNQLQKKLKITGI
ncbi:MAG: alpha/beta hydrolase [Bacteroidota bacterium]